MQNCNVGQVCCVMPGTVDAGVNGSCTDMASCSGIVLNCAGAADCMNGENCCGSLTASGGSASCQATCSDLQVCLHSSECPMGMRCRRAPGGGGVRVCTVVPDAGMGGDGGGDDGGGTDGSTGEAGPGDAAAD